MLSMRRLSVAPTVLLTLVVWAGSARTAFADPFVFHESTIGVNQGCGVPGVTPACPFEVFNNRVVSAQALVFDNMVRGAGTPNVLTFSVAADASTGLHARTSVNLNLGTLVSRFVAASAQFSDLITLSSPSQPNGSPGTLIVGYDIDGILAESGIGNAFAFVDFEWGTTGLDDSQFHLYESSVHGSFQFDPIPFTYGNPFYLALGLEAVAGTQVFCPTCIDGIGIVAQSGIGTASFDAFHTVTLSQLLPSDAAGNPVLDVQFSSASGTQYSVNGVVPEPGSLLLLVSGLALGAGRWRRRLTR